ncbi:hypothetical protein FH972_002883 [Carpinus fangiana]|uniref:Uncharacterized protein n=1 Tax=Carpinus fangiana TaxID=176857 RepID=A0A5N6QGQ7_9ROSI|nr:hypothetical protein FH972_002883 [Carpinus fangiana]
MEKINSKLSAAVEEVTLEHLKKNEIVKHHSQEVGLQRRVFVDFFCNPERLRSQINNGLRSYKPTSTNSFPRCRPKPRVRGVGPKNCVTVLPSPSLNHLLTSIHIITVLHLRRRALFQGHALGRLIGQGAANDLATQLHSYSSARGVRSTRRLGVRRKGCPNYELLGLIFNGSTATGVFRHSFTRTPPDSDEENDLNDALLRFGMHVSAGGNAGVGNGTENVGGSWAGFKTGGGNVASTTRGIVFQEGEAVGPAQGKGKKSSSSMDSLRSDALKEFRDFVNLRKEMLIQDQQRRSNGGEASGGGASSGVSFSNSMSRALGLLDEVALDLDDERYLKAFNLFKDEITHDGFIAMAPARKKAWLASL